MEISNAEFIISNTDVKKCPAGRLPEYAFIGRSNVGKSSLINMLTGRKGLAMTSATPGKTMLINHFFVDDSWYLVDLPGYGYASRSHEEIKKWGDMIEEYLNGRPQLSQVALLVDSRHKPSADDVLMMEWIRHHSEYAIVFATKCDKLSKLKLQESGYR